MNRVAGTVGAVIVVAGVAWVGTAWYTGTKVEEELRASIDKTNQQLSTAVPEAGITVALASFDRSIFSSHARYSVTFTVPPEEGQPTQSSAPKQVFISDKIEHGPLPLSRLKTGHFGPAMATSNFELERNDVVEPWFKATQDKTPLYGQASLKYGGDVDGVLNLAPATYADEQTNVEFTGFEMDFDVEKKTGASKANGEMDRFMLKSVSEGEPFLAELKMLKFDGDMRSTIAGQHSMTIDQISLGTPEAPVIIDKYVQRLQADEADGKSSGTISYDVGQVKQGESVLATSAQFIVKVANFDTTAAKALGDIYTEAANRASAAGEASPAFTPEESKRLSDAAMQLLAANPSVAVDPFLITTPKGEARFNLAVDLTKPTDMAVGLDQLVVQTINKLDARVAVDKPLFAGYLADAMVGEGAPRAQAEAQALQQADMAAGMAAQMGVARMEGERLVSSLNYAGGTVDFNGQKMPVDEFAAMVVGLVFAGGGMMPDMADDDGATMTEPETSEPADELDDEVAPGEGAAATPVPQR